MRPTVAEALAEVFGRPEHEEETRTALAEWDDERAAVILEMLIRGEQDAKWLDGRHFDPTSWEKASAALHSLAVEVSEQKEKT